MYHAITITENVQNMKPVQNFTGFIFSTFHAVLHLKEYVRGHPISSVLSPQSSWPSHLNNEKIRIHHKREGGIEKSVPQIIDYFEKYPISQNKNGKYPQNSESIVSTYPKIDPSIQNNPVSL